MKTISFTRPTHRHHLLSGPTFLIVAICWARNWKTDKLESIEVVFGFFAGQFENSRFELTKKGKLKRKVAKRIMDAEISRKGFSVEKYVAIQTCQQKQVYVANPDYDPDSVDRCKRRAKILRPHLFNIRNV